MNKNVHFLTQHFTFFQPKADYNVFNLIIITAAVYGLVFAGVLLFSKKFRNKTNTYLAYVVLLISVSNIYNWLLDTEVFMVFGWRYYGLFFIRWDLLLLPMYLYFVASYLKKNEAKKKWYRYPFLTALMVSLFLIIAEIISPGFYQVHRESIRLYDKICEYITIAFILFLVYKSYALIRAYEKNLRIKTKAIRLETAWLKRLLYLAILLCVVWATLLIIDKWVYNNKLNYRQLYYFVWICMSLLIYWLGFLGVYHVGIFNQRRELRVVTSEGTKNNQTLKLKIGKFEEMNQVIRNEKLYLNPLLSLHLLAEKFNLSEGYISQHINSYANSNFSSYINSLRVEEAKRLLKEKEYTHFTIVAIGLESGFNSKTSFYAAFKKHTGMSPAQYRKK